MHQQHLGGYWLNSYFEPWAIFKEKTCCIKIIIIKTSTNFLTVAFNGNIAIRNRTFLENLIVDERLRCVRKNFALETIATFSAKPLKVGFCKVQMKIKV